MDSIVYVRFDQKVDAKAVLAKIKLVCINYYIIITIMYYLNDRLILPKDVSDKSYKDYKLFSIPSSLIEENPVTQHLNVRYEHSYF